MDNANSHLRHASFWLGGRLDASFLAIKETTWPTARLQAVARDQGLQATAHFEMLPEYGLINMNGRMYDPLNGRMLRPDNYVQDPTNTQSYNRYSYCWNNPLKYTDPSGELVWVLPYLTINKRGIDFGVSVGTGIPKFGSAQVNLSYSTTNNFSASVGATVSGVSGNVGWGTHSGFFANAGIGMSFAGFNTSLASAGVGWSQNGGVYAYGAGITLSQGGEVSFNPSLGYTYGFRYSRQAIRGGPSTADIRHDASGVLTSEPTEIIGHRNFLSWGSQESGWDNSKFALDIGGGMYGALQTAVRPGNQWLGKNGKYYNNSWGGNQHSGSRSGAFKAANTYKWAGRATLGVSAVIGAAETYDGYQMDGGQFGYNAQQAAFCTTGSLVGGYYGAQSGAYIGATIGLWFGGVGAIPGAIIGGFIGGLGGGYLGGNIGSGAVDYYYGK